ncbi:uncharacterized protein HD556DRAFT_1311981 [Suillus plorans]|uniref:Uncharacterized protein n=1 Tax=Suillus plorans TaxID=116603 RepID=A0A9P7AHG7_9AGAM|nr:uncharacterized protein HD556DRAFT_1311981 [Suillus plorans]KAG1788570.1 hypothetical protein HD556DRAFT_1311981 [Suillus plorans]
MDRLKWARSSGALRIFKVLLKFSLYGRTANYAGTSGAHHASLAPLFSRFQHSFLPDSEFIFDSIWERSLSCREKKWKKVCMDDVDFLDHPAIIWARSRMIMDLVATKGWMKNETRTEKELMNIYLGEIVAQANALFHRTTKNIKSLLKYGVSQFRNHLAVTADRFVCLHNLEPKKEDNLSDSARQAFMMALRTQIFDSNQQWTYFLHRQVYTADSVILHLFGNLALEETHLGIWYGSKYSPFRDMNMRAEIKTTMPLMLSESAAGAQCAIDRAVEGCLSDSRKGVPHFSAKLYASRQAAYHNTILESLADPLHKESLEARFLALHRRGLELTDTPFGLSTPSQIVYVPTRRDEIVRPLPQSSSAAMRMPIQEGLQYLTGHHHADLAQGTSSMAYSGTGVFIDEELEYNLEADKNLMPDTILNQGTYRFF